VPCYYPRDCAQSRTENVICTDGKRKREFIYGVKVKPGSLLYKNYEATQVPCGSCIGCRLEKSRQDAVRCVHEASLYEDNCFVTLTYSDDFLPPNSTLVKEHVQLFMKRLRDYVFRSSPEGRLDPSQNVTDGQAKRVRFLACGEYGDNFGRPHYHLLIFNYDFPDRVFFDVQNGFNLYRSSILESLWPFGFSLVGDVSFESAAYVCRYVLKKVSGELAEGWYDGRIPEFSLRSLKPGIGAPWLERYQKSVFPDDFIVIRGGVRCKPPRYYDVKLNLTNPELYASIKLKRKEMASKSKHNSPERLAVRRRVKLAQTKMLKRRLK